MQFLYGYEPPANKEQNRLRRIIMSGIVTNCGTGPIFNGLVVVQGQSLTVTPLTVTVGYSDTLSETKTITNRFQAVRVTNMWLQ